MSLTEEQIEAGDYKYDRLNEEGHTKECALWHHQNTCTCYIRQLDNYMYEDWENENPPRVSKSRKPSFVVRGRSIFQLWDKMRRG